MALSIQLLGPPQLSVDGEPVTSLRSDKALALLAYVAVEADRDHRREKLAGLLWPDYTESSARANLRRALSDLRQALETAAPAGNDGTATPLIETSRQTIGFNAEAGGWVDVSAFTAGLWFLQPMTRTRPPSAGSAVDQLEEAVSHYRGPFLEGFSLPDSPAFEEWATLTRERLHRLAIQALHHLADTYQQQGAYERALQHAWRQLEMDPWRENAHRQVMRLLTLTGQRGAALAQYEVCRRILKAELDAEPSEETQTLYQQLLHEEWPVPAPGAARPARAVGACPYRGLSAFREQDAAFFFGREASVRRLAKAVHQQSLAALVGSSGSGKSSVLYAGLLPLLSRDSARDRLIASCRPGPQPYYALAGALLPLLEPDSRETDRLLQIPKLAAALRGGDLGLCQVAERIVGRHTGGGRLFLIIDQFEELYTQCPEPATQRAYLDLLLQAVDGAGATPAPLLGLLIALRADFMGQALAYGPLAEALQDRTLMLGPMSRDELRAAIQKPAEVQGAAFAPGLVDRMLDDVGQEPGNLPLLEFALTLLWEEAATGRLTHEAYETLGRVDGALAAYADRVFAELDPAGQEGARRIFVQLVQPGEGTADTRRRATRAEVGEADWPLARHLADQRLVVTGQDADGSEKVEVVHEALIENWQQLRDWLETDRAFRVWQEGLRSALRQWQVTGRDEGALWRGAALLQAEEWLAAREEELSEAEKAFIYASVSLRAQRAAEREAQQQQRLAVERRARRILAALAAVLALTALVTLALTVWSSHERHQALEAYSLSLAANARESLSDLDTAKGLALALAANGLRNPPREAQRVLMEAAYAPGARWRAEVASLFDGVRGPVTSLAIGPDGRTALAGLEDGLIILWDLETREEIHRLRGHTARVHDIALGPDGSTALSGGEDAQAILWDLGSGQEIRRFGGHTGVVRAVDIGPDGRTAVSGGFAGASMMAPGELILWDLDTGSEIRRFEGHTAGIVAAKLAPDGRTLLASSGDAEIFSTAPPGETLGLGSVPFDMILWDVRDGEVIRRYEALGNDAFSLSISPDGTRALAGSFYDNVSVLWDLNTGEKIQVLEGHHEGVRVVAFGPDGRRAVSGSGDDSLILWDVSTAPSTGSATAQAVARLSGSGGDILDLAISPDGRTCLSSSRDGGLTLWDLTDAAEIQRLAGHRDMVWDVAFTPDGRRALSSSGAASPSLPVQDASIRLWDLETGRQTQRAALPVHVIFQVAVSADGRTALVATSMPAVRVWDLESWQEIGQLAGHAGPVTAVEFAPDGLTALSASTDGTLILWDQPGRRAIHRLDGHGELWSLAMGPDGHTALSDSGNSTMILWDLEAGQEIRSFVRQNGTQEPGSSGQAFLPDGRTALSCAPDGALIEWNLETGEEIRTIGVHAALRTRVVVSPDGRLALTAGMDGSLRVWDLETGELIRRSDGHGVIFDVALSPDGGSILFGSADTTITHWRLERRPAEALKAWVDANRYVRDLTCEEREMYQIEPLCETP